MKKLITLFALAVALIIPGVVSAAQYIASDETGNIIVEESSTPRNLYTAGNNIRVDADVAGDLVLAGSNITINGTIEQSLLGAGGAIVVNGSVSRTARLAGGNILIQSNIGEDLIAGSGIIDIAKNVQIGGDVVVAGGTVNLAGTVNGSVILYGGEVVITGVVKGNVTAKDVEKITVADSAQIGGNLTYASPEPGNISDEAVQGEIIYKQISRGDTLGKVNLVSALYSLIGTVLTLLIVFYLLPKWSAQTTVGAFDKFWQKLGIGFLALVVTPIVIILLMAATLGLLTPLSFLLGTLYILTLIISGIMVPLLVGYLVFILMKQPQLDWKTIAAGAIAASAISFLPFAGPLFLFGIFLIALGEITTQIWHAGKKQR